MILLEQNFDSVQHISESVGDTKKLYLTGVMSEANRKNRNGRIYERSDLETIVKQINDAATLNRHILGETDHPATLEVKLANVSHKIVEAWMDGDALKFKSEVLNTPNGQILQSLIQSGISVGVSTRGAGSVNESTGRVSNYRFITLDAVAMPSCQNAYPETLREQYELAANNGIITDLSEAANKDPIAQKYFEIQLKQFIKSLSTNK